jgi:hypothetical protein
VRDYINHKRQELYTLRQYWDEMDTTGSKLQALTGGSMEGALTFQVVQLELKSKDSRLSQEENPLNSVTP